MDLSNQARLRRLMALMPVEKVWGDGHRYPKTGVMLGSLFSQGAAQLNLVDKNAPRANREALTSLMDKLSQQGRGRGLSRRGR